MAENFDEQRLQRFENTPRVTARPGHGMLRNGRIVAAGSMPATDDTTYWDVEILNHLFQRIDININDRFATGAPVYPVLVNVAAPGGASYEADAEVSVNVPASVASVDTGAVDASTGYARTPGQQCSVVSAGGGGGCYGSILFGALV